MAIPVNIIIAVPYGFYRDRAMRLAHRVSPSARMKSIADVVAYVTFQSPVYVAILFSVGADWHQIAAAVSSNIAISMLMGRFTATSSITADACSASALTSRLKPESRRNLRLTAVSRLLVYIPRFTFRALAIIRLVMGQTRLRFAI